MTERPSGASGTAAEAGTRPCPICRKPGIRRFRPFCSKRCADVDLGRWFGEVYRIPEVERDEEDDPTPIAGEDQS